MGNLRVLLSQLNRGPWAPLSLVGNSATSKVIPYRGTQVLGPWTEPWKYTYLGT
jgi:hypothetical protein